MDCEHNVGIESTVKTRGVKTIISTCRKLGRCVSTADQLRAIGVSKIVTCEGCRFFSLGHVDWVTCELRGDPTGREVNCHCGIERTIYKCELHGECLKRLPAGKRPTGLEGVTICQTCRDVPKV